MRKKIYFFLLPLLLFPATTPADEYINCAVFNEQDCDYAVECSWVSAKCIPNCFDFLEDEGTCKTIMGCQWDEECSGCSPGSYCPGDGVQESCEAPFDDSFAYSTSIEDCFARLTCDNDSGTEAGVPYTESNNYQLIPIVNEAFAPSATFQYHLEVPSTGFSCESNSNKCNNFGKSPQSLNCALSDDTVTWNNNSNNWYVANCKCNTDSASIQDKNCTGPQQYVAIEDQTGVTHVGDPIHFETTPEIYYCNSCIADSGNDIYYADINATESNCDKNVSAGKVCACTKLTDKGFYRTGNCGANQNWGPQSDICLAQVCPLPGQTTLTLGPTNPTDCQYTEQT